jgi:hypothetical protein
MTSHSPPVPPDQRSPKGSGHAQPDNKPDRDRTGREPKAAEQGRQGNIHQNTTNQGLQQDR